MQTISFSEVSAYRKCPKAWDYKYKQRLKRKQKHVRLLRGEILHEMLNAYVERKIHGLKYDGPDPWDTLETYAAEFANYFEAEKEMHGDIIGDCGKIFEGYLRKYRKDVLRYEETELVVEVDLSGLGAGALPVMFVGVIDKIARDAQKRRWVMDHKFVKTIPSADDRFAELQLLLYFWAYGMNNPKEKLDGVCWDYGRAKAPTEPDVLKNGSLSKRKNLDCDVYTYRNAIRKAGLVEQDYDDMLKHLQGKEDTFFERVFLPKPTTDMIVEVVNDFLQTTAEILIKRDEGRCVRAMSQWNCATCDFRPLCEAEVRGLDAEFVKKNEYVARGSSNE